MKHRSVQIWEQVKGFWHDTDRILKRTSIILWLVGCTLLALGVWGDKAGFWTYKPFLTNTFSALTGAAFGIPLALIVLQRISSSQADAAEARAAQRLAARVSESLASEVAASIRIRNPNFQAVREVIDSQFREAYSLVHGTVSEADIPLYVDIVEKVFQEIDGILSPEGSRHLAEVSVQWSILNTEVRSRLLETGGKWLDAVTVRALDEATRLATGPTIDNWYHAGRSFKGPEGFLEPGFHNSEESDLPVREESDLPVRLELSKPKLTDFPNWIQDANTIVDIIVSLVNNSSLVVQTFGSTPATDAGNSQDAG